MARVICPFCLKPHDFSKSLNCETYPEAVVPYKYIKDYNKVPPLWLVTIGFSQHGKTTYLTALTLVLEKISKIWKNVYYLPLDQYTLDAIRQMRREAVNGELPESSPKKVPRPLLFNVYDLPISGSRSLIMYDVAGEIYNSLSEVQEYVTSIKQVSTTWFLVSLDDLINDKEGKALPDLFQTYLSGMEGLKVELSGRNLIVVYTKGDLLSNEFKEYQRSDPIQNLTLRETDEIDAENFSFDTYIEKMKDISAVFEDYTRKRVEGGAAFINMVKASGMNLVFSVTSALGVSPEVGSNRMRENARRYRVLDPFLWAIVLESKQISRTIRVIADASPESQAVFADGLFLNICKELSEYSDVTTYYAGKSSPISQPGQRVPEEPPSYKHYRLIGPILENASKDSFFIVVTTGEILDLLDFNNATWQDRLIIISCDEKYQPDWPNFFILRVGDNFRVLLDSVLRLYDGRK